MYIKKITFGSKRYNHVTYHAKFFSKIVIILGTINI